MVTYDDWDDVVEESDTPGPGEYKNPSTVGKWTIHGGGRSAVFTGRYGAKDDRQMPGPGAYAPKEKRDAAAFSMGTAPRSGNGRGKGSPGPAAYSLGTTVGKASAFTFGNSDRSSAAKSCNSPGPVYSLKGTIITNKGNLFSKAGRSAVGHTEDGPGPNAYMPGTLDKRQFVKFGTGGRSPTCATDGHAVPGPGEYVPNMSPTTPRAHTTRFGNPRERKIGLRDRSPGPSDYNQDLRPITPRSPTAKFGKAALGGPKSVGEDLLPGPGAYKPRNTLVDQFHKGGKLGKAERAGPAGDSESPGPVYNLDNSNGVMAAAPRFSFGTSKRQPAASNRGSPGPAYELPTSIGTAPKYGFGTADRSPSAGKSSQSPGPVYNIKSQLGKHGISFSKAGRSNAAKASNSPGPVYNPTPGRGGAPKYSFSHGVRGGPASGETAGTPGPGEYVLPANKGGGISMLFRHPGKMLGCSPGPAAYKPEVKPTVTKSPGWTWSKGRPRPRTSGVRRRKAGYSDRPLTAR